jgi:2'-5' RNA ligase
MIALYPPPDLAKALAIAGGLPWETLHLTVAYIGDAADVDPQALNEITRLLARRPRVQARLSGRGRFTGGDRDIIIALADSPQIEDLRRDALTLLAAAGIPVPREHGYTPHLTLLYCDPADPDPVGRLAAAPVTFTAVSAVHGGDRVDYPLTDPAATIEASRVRVAYAAGWALSGGPMTARVKAGCAAAVAEAAIRPHDPDLLEATTRLGHLEGTHALTAARRDKLLRHHQAAVLAAWNACMAELEIKKLVARYRADVYLTRSSPKPADPDANRDWWRDAALAAALGFLRGIYRTKGYQALITAIEDAIRAGMAEGEADALAAAASQQGITGFDIAAAFLAAYERLKDDPGVTARALAALTMIIDSAAADAARKLAALTADGASEEEMEAAAGETTTGGKVQAVLRWAQYALWAAIGTAALRLWSANGTADGSAQTVNWVTSSGNPCQVCQDNEAGSPYAPSDVPAYPAHPNCQCFLDANSPLPGSLLTSFLSGDG